MDAALPVREMAADAAVLFLWCVDSMLADALAVIAAWGFTYKCVAFVWAKTRADGSGFPIGTGYWTRANPELCLLATRGRPKRLHADVRKLILAPRREHSRKPDEVRERIERLVAGPYIELFARSSAPGWDTAFSDQAGLFDPGSVAYKSQTFFAALRRSIHT